MNFGKFDRYLLRTTGILFLALVVTCLCTTLYFIFKSRTENNSAKNNASIKFNKNTKKEEFLNLSEGSKLEGTTYYLIPLADTNSSKTNFTKYSGRYSRGDSRNFYLYDTSLNKGEWIFPDHSKAITKFDVSCYKNDDCGKKEPVTGLIFQIIEKDSNNDEELDSKDRKNIVYYTLSTKNKISIEEDVDDVIGIEILSKEKILITYSKNKETFILSFLINSLKVENKTKISI